MTMSSNPDTVAPEQLTEEERAHLEWFAAKFIGKRAELETKLLRLHDHLQARVRELEQENSDDATEYLELEKQHQAEALDMAARIRELEASPEQAKVRGLERFAALAILTHWDAEGQGGPREPAPWPAAVKALTEQYNGYDVQHCRRCKQWAPVARPTYTCAPGWGCAPPPPVDDPGPRG